MGEALIALLMSKAGGDSASDTPPLASADQSQPAPLPQNALKAATPIALSLSGERGGPGGDGMSAILRSLGL